MYLIYVDNYNPYKLTYQCIYKYLPRDKKPQQYNSMKDHEALIFQENFRHLEKLVYHLIKFAIKTILSDAEPLEEHNATKYSPIE